MRRIIVGMVLGMLVLVGCTPKDLPFQWSDLPTGSVEQGAILFNAPLGKATACSACHTLDGKSGGVGPTLKGYGAIASTRVKNQSAEDYTLYSIFRPAKFIVDGYSNVMYSDFAQELNAQQTADLIAFLLAQ